MKTNNPLLDMLDEMSKLRKPPFYSNLYSSTDDTSMNKGEWYPAVDVTEGADCFKFEVDLPGVARKDIEVSFNKGVLTIKGERQASHKENQAVDGKKYTRIEKIYGTFYRQFTLPESIDQDNISARCDNGVLTIIVPKKEALKPRVITVEEAA